MLDKLNYIPHILFYAAVVGLLWLCMEHVLGKVKEPLKQQMGLH